MTPEDDSLRRCLNLEENRGSTGPTPQLPFWRVLLAAGAAAAAFAIVAPPHLSSESTHLGSAGAFYGVALTWWMVFMYRSRRSVRDFMGQRLRSRDIVLISGAILAVFCSSLGSSALLTLLDLAPDASYDALFAPRGAASKVMALLVMAIMAPCAEEILFRGLLFPRLLRYARSVPAALFSSLIFGAAHLDPVGATVFGLLMVVLYTRTRSLLAPILAHTLNNLVALLLSWAEAALGGTFPISLWWIAALLPLSLPWILWFLLRGLRHLKTQLSP